MGKMIVDILSSIDVTSRLDKYQARKVLSQILKSDLNFISYSKHGEKQMVSRNLTTQDIINVLCAGKIMDDSEFENGSWRYRVFTSKITVVIAFRRPHQISVVTLGEINHEVHLVWT